MRATKRYTKRPKTVKESRKESALKEMKKKREERSKRLGVDRSDSFTKLRDDARTAPSKKTSVTPAQVSSTELYSPTVKVVQNKFRSHEGVIPEVKLDKKKDNKVKKILNEGKKIVKMVESGVDKTAKTVAKVEQKLSPYLQFGATVAQDSGHPMVAKGVMALDAFISETAAMASKGKDAYNTFANPDYLKGMLEAKRMASDVHMVDAVTPLPSMPTNMAIAQ